MSAGRSISPSSLRRPALASPHASHRSAVRQSVTHDYRSHGTTTLFAALNTTKGTVLTASATTSASRICGLSAADRQQHAVEPRRARGRGQLRNPPTPASELLAGRATAISCALHSDLRLLAQLGGDLVQPDHATSYPARNLSRRKRTGDQDRSIRRKRQS